MARSRTDPLPSTVCGPGAQDAPTISAVIDPFVETEIKKRADILTAGVNTMRQLEADLKKITPDVANVENGTSPYTAARLKELVRNRQKMANLDAAISAVLEKHDADSYNKLDQTIKKIGGKRDG